MSAGYLNAVMRALRVEAETREADCEDRREDFDPEHLKWLEGRARYLRGLADALTEEANAVVRVMFLDGDVESIADEQGVDLATARERAEEWSSAIRDRLIEQGNELLANVIRDGQP